MEIMVPIVPPMADDHKSIHKRFGKPGARPVPRSSPVPAARMFRVRRSEAEGEEDHARGVAVGAVDGADVPRVAADDLGRDLAGCQAAVVLLHQHGCRLFVAAERDGALRPTPGALIYGDDSRLVRGDRTADALGLPEGGR